MPSAQVTQSAQVTEIPSAQVTARPLCCSEQLIHLLQELALAKLPVLGCLDGSDGIGGQCASSIATAKLCSQRNSVF